MSAILWVLARNSSSNCFTDVTLPNNGDDLSAIIMAVKAAVVNVLGNSDYFEYVYFSFSKVSADLINNTNVNLLPPSSLTQYLMSPTFIDSINSI